MQHSFMVNRLDLLVMTCKYESLLILLVIVRQGQCYFDSAAKSRSYPMSV